MARLSPQLIHGQLPFPRQHEWTRCAEKEYWFPELRDILTLYDAVVANILCRRIQSGVSVRQGQCALHSFITNTNPAIPTLPREHAVASYTLLLEQWIDFIPGEIALRQYICSV